MPARKKPALRTQLGRKGVPIRIWVPKEIGAKFMLIAEENSRTLTGELSMIMKAHVEKNKHLIAQAQIKRKTLAHEVDDTRPEAMKHSGLDIDLDALADIVQ